MSPAHPRPVRSLSVQVKSTKGRAKMLESGASDEQKGGLRGVSECPAHPRPVRSLGVQVKAPKGRAKVLEKRTSRRAEGGSDEGAEGRICCAEARPTFPDVRGQGEDIILGNREAQN
ncbi:hypothetical protein TNIN_342311 [Trichonephila inaurata madagascariensis]|uniref:Uncharacterized protein n=1 Tax=Trichonephila inaurata madagascariensis TaxID=2747483 RepID=A0A8X6WMG0_9ARAC|nr:hypothetical protein TNIN_342311 [Trichonephila inaurata madagascariensis]